MKCCCKFIYPVVIGIFAAAMLISCGEDEEDVQIPAVPQGLKHVILKGKILLNWQEAQNAETYIIYRTPPFEDEKIITNVPSYEDINVTPDKTYTYKIAGISRDGVEGKPSAEYQVTYQEGLIQVSDENIDFGQLSEHYDLKVTNAGGLGIQWELETKEKWINTDPKQGNLNPQGEQVIRITVNRTEEPGEYSGTVLVKTENKAIKIAIQMEVLAEPRIATEPSDPLEFVFDNVQQTHILTIKNVGTGILEWQIKNIPNWLELDYTQGQTSRTPPSRIQFAVKNGEQLSPKTYVATLSVNSNDKTKPTLTMNITLNVPEPDPKLDISESILKFTPSEPSKSMDILNTGGGVMEWIVKIDSKTQWLRIDPSQGRTNANGSDPLVFIIDTRYGNPGETLSTSIVIDAGKAGTEEIVVELSIPGEKWSVSPGSIILADNMSDSISISNLSAGNLSWSANSSGSWILLSHKSGEIESGESDIIQVSGDTSTLRLGVHTGKISISSRTKEESISVQLTKMAYITGQVLYSRSGAPIEDIQISLDSKSPKLYRNGDFQIERLTPGAFQIKAEKDGYISAIFAGEVDEWGNVEPVEMWMRPIPRVTNMIRNPAIPFEIPVDVCFSSDRTRAYISDGSGSMFIINALADSVTHQMIVGIQPMGIIANPQNDDVYLADAESHQVIILDAQNRHVVGRIDVDRYPQQLAISQDGNWLYVTCRDTGSVVHINTDDRQIENRFSVGREPDGIAISPEGMTIYVANAGDNTISVLDAFDGRRLSLIQVSERPQHLAVSEDYVYVSNSFGDQISVIYRNTNKLVRNIGLGNALLLGDILVIEEPEGGDVVYVIDQTNSQLHIIDSVTFEVVGGGISVGDIPVALAVGMDLTKIYVVNGTSADVSVLEFR
jgi:YVTN family beta-propeller protein